MSEPDAHVVFSFTPDEDGWPPVGSERVWATTLGGGRFRIENVPWFARNIAVGDVVSAAVPDPAFEPEFVELLEASDHATLRLIMASESSLERAFAMLEEFGLWIEGAPHYGMLALDVPPDANFAGLAATLASEVAGGRWYWEEGRITPQWLDAKGAAGLP